MKITIKTKGIAEPGVWKRKSNRLMAEAVNASFLANLAKHTKTMIYARVKRGFGVYGGVMFPLKKLSPSYIERRRGQRVVGKRGKKLKNKRQNKPTLGPQGTPTKSNLTWTGQMLESFYYKVRRTGFTLGINDSARRHMDKNKMDDLTNEEVAIYASKKRPFFNLSHAEYRNILDKYRQHVKLVAKRIFR